MNATKQTQAAFTKGPWHWHHSRTNQHLHDVAGNCFAQVSMPQHARYAANANLIAAAPALYEAGERVIKAFEALGTPRAATNAQKDECEGALLALDAALRQARGEA